MQEKLFLDQWWIIRYNQDWSRTPILTEFRYPTSSTSSTTTKDEDEEK
jgi:hypothetical protein